MEYRSRLYAKYASGVKRVTTQAAHGELDRWGSVYDTYLRGWLPQRRDAAIGDLGCGSGGFLRFLQARGYTNLTGIDLSAEQVELARSILPGVQQAEAVEFLTRNRERFELLVALDLIEHLAKDESLRFLDACREALRPGGRLVLQTPNGESPWGGATRYGDFTHEICFTPHSLETLLRITGFGGVESREAGVVARGLKSGLRWVAWRCIRAGLLAVNLAETGSKGSGVVSRVFLASGIREG